MQKYNQINEWLAIKLTQMFGSMTTFWVLLIMVLIPVIPKFESWMPTVQFISSGVVQLIALPVILLGTNLLGRYAEKRAEEDHEEIKAMHLETQALLRELKDEKAAIQLFIDKKGS